MNEKEKQKTQRRLPGGPGLYAAVAVFLLAAGVIGRSMANLRAALPGGTSAAPATTAGSVTRFAVPPVEFSAAPTSRAAPAAQTTAPAEQAVFENQTPKAGAEQTTAAAKQTYRLPVNGGVLADYSMGEPVFSATMGDYRTHNGVDLKAEAGEEVHAIAPGTVVSVEEDRLYGNTVRIDHGNGVVSTLCGLADEGLIRSGAAVDASTVVGTVGEIPAEAKEAAHVHLEIRQNGALTDPLALLGLDGSED